MRTLVKGDRVVYDGRSHGSQEGVIERRVVLRAYTDPSDRLVYYAITGAALLVPDSDILEVL